MKSTTAEKETNNVSEHHEVAQFPHSQFFHIGQIVEDASRQIQDVIVTHVPAEIGSVSS
jgi:hypothetical protein